MVRDRYRQFRLWRQARPFWAGVWVLAAGLEIAAIPSTGFRYLLVQGIGGAGSLGIGLGLAGVAVVLWTRPATSRTCGLVAVALAFASYPAANLGGFLIGMVLALLGGSLAVAWHLVPVESGA